MQEIRTSGSEGGWASNGPVYPTSLDQKNLKIVCAP